MSQDDNKPSDDADVDDNDTSQPDETGESDEIEPASDLGSEAIDLAGISSFTEEMDDVRKSAEEMHQIHDDARKPFREFQEQMDDTIKKLTDGVGGHPVLRSSIVDALEALGRPRLPWVEALKELHISTRILGGVQASISQASEERNQAILDAVTKSRLDLNRSTLDSIAALQEQIKKLASPTLPHRLTQDALSGAAEAAEALKQDISAKAAETLQALKRDQERFTVPTPSYQSVEMSLPTPTSQTQAQLTRLEERLVRVEEKIDRLLGE